MPELAPGCARRVKLREHVRALGHRGLGANEVVVGNGGGLVVLDILLDLVVVFGKNTDVAGLAMRLRALATVACVVEDHLRTRTLLACPRIRSLASTELSSSALLASD